MLGEVRTYAVAQQTPAWSKQPAEANGVTSAFYPIVADCGSTYAKAQAAKAEMLMPRQTMDYGETRLPCGTQKVVWTVGEYNPWVSPSATE